MTELMIKGLCLFWLSLSVIVNVLAESPEPIELNVNQDFDLLRDAPGYSGVEFEVVVFRNVGWSEAEVSRVITEASQIYYSECRFDLETSRIRFIEVSQKLNRMNSRRQEQFLAELSDLQRPAIFFIADTHMDDFAAYAYLERTVSPSQGTVWITRNADKQCRGPMLAHEVGHIALNTGKHSLLDNNLMGFSCRRSNVSRQPVNTKLTPKQCKNLWKRYRH